MSKSERARSQPEGAQRKAPGRGSDGDYYHEAVRNKSQFKTFRTHDVGDPGGIQRVAGQRKSGTWGTVKWLIPKEWAHMKGGKLIADSDDAAPSWRLAQKMFCIPRGVTASELRSALIHHVSEHPEEEDLNAAILVGNAFIETYPCD